MSNTEGQIVGTVDSDEPCVVHLEQSDAANDPSDPIHQFGACSNKFEQPQKNDASGQAPIQSLQSMGDASQAEKEKEEVDPAKYLTGLTKEDTRGTQMIAIEGIHSHYCNKHANVGKRELSYGIETSTAVKPMNVNSDANIQNHISKIKDVYQKRFERIRAALKMRAKKVPESEIAKVLKGSSIFSMEQLRNETPSPSEAENIMDEWM
jgi:hypothetical protein